MDRPNKYFLLVTKSTTKLHSRTRKTKERSEIIGLGFERPQ